MDVSHKCEMPVGLDEEWDLIEALVGGTRAMRCAGQLYMPKRTMEEQADYDCRLRNATLFPAFTETLGVMTGRVFSEPVQYTDDVPKWMQEEVLDDADLQGRNMHVFARGWFAEALGYGLSHCLVDAPPAEGAVTRDDARRQNLRPYLIRINPRQVLGWRESGGKLTQLRVKFKRMEADGEFGEKCVEEIRSYDLVASRVLVRVWEKSANAAWVQTAERFMAMDRIPLVTYYTGRTGFMTARPPLRELAYLNAKHWAMQSSYDALIETASVPILAIIGAQDSSTVVIGAKNAVHIDSPQGDMKFVEHSGAAIKAGRDALQDLKEEMRQAGAKLLVPQGTTKTATQAGEESARENSSLGAMVQDLEDVLDDLMDVIAAWRGEQDGGSVKVQANLDPDFAPADSMRVVLEMRRDGVLSDQTAFEEGKRRGFVSDEVEWEEEQERIENQAPPPPPPGMPTLPAPGVDPANPPPAA